MLSSGSCSENLDELRHVVQFCEGEEPLLANVTRYVYESLDRGGSILVIASADHGESLAASLQEYGLAFDRAAKERRILFADSEQTLDRFLVDRMPDWRRFQRTMNALLQQLQPPFDRGIRAYGEMVTELWRRGEYVAAARLEHYWNRILSANGVQLFCAYPLDVLNKQFHPDIVNAVLGEHSHVLSAAGTNLVDAIEYAMKEVLGVDPGEHQLDRFRAANRPAWPMLPDAEAIILWLQGNLQSDAEKILARARLLLTEPIQTDRFDGVFAPIA